MRRQKWIIFLFITSITMMHGQIVDVFTSPSGEINDNWIGDRENFVITKDHRLRLFDKIGGKSSLVSQATWQENQEWELSFQMEFDPSDNNRLDIHLWSDKEEIALGTGILIGIGEDGIQDAITLYSQSNGEKTKIGSGTMGLVAKGPVLLRLKASIDNDMLVIETDAEGGFCFLTEIEAPIEGPEKGVDFFFGWECIYTQSRSTLFYFDDVYVGSERIDLSPPRIISCLKSMNTVDILFSEPLDTSLTNRPDYVLIPSISDLVFLGSKNKITFSSASGFNNLVHYQLNLTDVRDASGNSLDTMLTFVVPGKAIEGSLLINELLFNPRGSGSDYVELINNSEGPISFSGLVLSNELNGKSVDLSHLPYLPKGEILALSDNATNVIQDYPSHDVSRIFQIDIPGFNNDMGNVTLSIGNTVIDFFNYDEDFHHPLIDDHNGISLERISLDRPTNDRDNWTSSTAKSGFGTPGLPNSVSGYESAARNFISLEFKVFSPNDDGYRDELIIKYDLDGHGYAGTFSIFNDHGGLITELGTNELLLSSGEITWDGRDQSGQQALSGIYILYASLFHPDGRRYDKKLSCGLGDFLK